MNQGIESFVTVVSIMIANVLYLIAFTYLTIWLHFESWPNDIGIFKVFMFVYFMAGVIGGPYFVTVKTIEIVSKRFSPKK